MLAFVAAPSASAQVSRIALETRHCQHENYVNVYEYDFVDVQPQFPGDDRGLMNYINHERKYRLKQNFRCMDFSKSVKFAA